MLLEAAFNVLRQITPAIAVGLALTVIVVIHVIPYYADPYNMRKHPGPFLAKFSDIWLAYVSRSGQRSQAVHKLHLRYGTHVRIAPNHLSISDPKALQVIYAYGNGALKTDFYDALVSIRRSVFNTRSRAEHTRKRKAISHIFSAARVSDFEPRIRDHVVALINQWDRMLSGAVKGSNGSEAGGWHGAKSRLWIDCLPWLNYLSFDMTSDLIFSAPFGMVKAGNDLAPVSYVRHGMFDHKAEHENVSAIESRSNRGKVLVGTAVLPPWLRPLAHKLLTRNFHHHVDPFSGIASLAVSKRFETPVECPDLLSKLQETKDAEGNIISREEVTAEAIGQLVAGSTTVSNTACAALYYLAREQNVQSNLQRELDDQLENEDEMVSTLEQVKRLPYLNKLLNETMRIHSISAIGLPRVLPEGGLDVVGDYFPGGTVLSVPSFTIHRDKHVWGEDADVFRPERWDERDGEIMRKAFNPFSYGPRACVGRNLALLELQIIMSSLVRRYHFVLEKEGQTLETTEEFLLKATSCRVGVKRRNVL